MFRTIREYLEHDEEGFTLIELLVVVIIIGILAAIAIPAFLSQRDGARTSAVDASLRSGATYMEVVYTDTDSYPTADAAGVTALEGVGFRKGDMAFTVEESGTDGFCLEGVHNGDATIVRNLNTTPGSPGTPQDGPCA